MKQNENSNDYIFLKKVGVVDKYNFYEYISVMLDGGVGVTESLSTVKEKISSPYFRKKIEELIVYISSGDSFSKSMKKISGVFEFSEISIVESGETTGQLSESLMKLSDDLKKVHNLKNKIKEALTYPIIIFIFLIIAITIVLTYVIPAIKPLFEDAGVGLPLTTQALISTSDFIINNFFLIILIIITFILFVIVYANTRTGRIRVEKLIFKFPLLGKVYKNYLLANIASTLGNLVGSGVSILKSLSLTGRASKSLIYEILFEQIADEVKTGEAVVSSMSKVDKEGFYFPSDYLQMLSVGEKTANLEEISKKISKQYEKEVEYSLSGVTKWIEPIAIFLAGLFVAWFAFAIFGAMLKITQNIA